MENSKVWLGQWGYYWGNLMQVRGISGEYMFLQWGGGGISGTYQTMRNSGNQFKTPQGDRALTIGNHSAVWVKQTTGVWFPIKD